MPAVVQRLRDATERLDLPLRVDEVDRALGERRSLVQQLDDYVLPRLHAMDAPLLTVVGGSTGAGKSTLVNSLVGEVVSHAGVLRPTTRASVLVHHPDDEHWFTDERVLPGLTRVTGGRAAVEYSPLGVDAGHVQDPGSVRLVASEAVPAGMAILDAPDIDSVVDSNRAVAVQVLSAADLWIFVTTASRYSDAVPWELLRQAADRGTSVAVVLDRVPPEAMNPVRRHLAELLTDNGLHQATVFTINETALGEDGRLPDAEFASLRSWLTAIAGDARARDVVIRRTLGGVLSSLPARARRLRRAGRDQLRAQQRLATLSASAYSDAVAAVEDGVADGTLLRGEVLARWQELVGTGEFLRQVEAGIAKARDRISGYLRGRAPRTEPLGEALQTGAAALVTSQGETAAAQIATSWRRHPGGAALIAEHPDLARATPELRDTVDRMIRDWQQNLIELVRQQAGRKRATARYLAFGVNGIAVMLMLVVFSATAGLTGAEVAVAGGSAVVAQRLLEAIFGDQAVRDLAVQARTLLVSKVDEVYQQERQRYVDVLEGVFGNPDALNELESAIEELEELT